MPGASFAPYDFTAVLTEDELTRLVRAAVLEGAGGGVRSFERGDPIELDELPVNSAPGKRAYARVRPPSILLVAPDLLILRAPLEEVTIYDDQPPASGLVGHRGHVDAQFRIGYGADGNLALIPDGDPTLTVPGLHQSNAPVALEMPTVALPLAAPGCPVAAADPAPAAVRTPAFESPRPRCLDFEIAGRGDASRLVLKGMLSPLGVARGTGGAPAPADVGWAEGAAVGVGVANAFLLEEALPPPIIAGLVRHKIAEQVAADATVPADRRDAVTAERVAQERDALAARHFRVRPFEIAEPFRVHVRELRAPQDPWRENLELRRFSPTIPPGGDHVRLELEVEAYLPGADIEGTVVFEARPTARRGSLAFETELVERRLTVTPTGAGAVETIAVVAAVTAGVGTIVGAVIGGVVGFAIAGPPGAAALAFVGGWAGLVLGGLVGAIAATVVFAILSGIASLAPVGAALPSTDATPPEGLSLRTDDADLDDLVLRGGTTLAEERQVAFWGTTRLGASTWSLDLDAETAAAARDAAAGGGDVTFADGRLTAAQDAALVVLGAPAPRTAGQVDLVDADWEPGASIDVQALIASLPVFVRGGAVVVGVRTRRKRRAVLVLIPTTAGVLGVFRRYRGRAEGVTLTYGGTRRAGPVEVHSETVTVPVDLGWSRGPGGGTVVDVPVDVGWRITNESWTVTVTSTSYLVRRPFGIEWAVVDGDERTALRAGSNAVRVGGVELELVVDGATCTFSGDTSGEIVLEAVYTELGRADGRSFAGRLRAGFSGGSAELVGLDEVERFLSPEVGRRLVRDPGEIEVGLRGDPDFTDPVRDRDLPSPGRPDESSPGRPLPSLSALPPDRCELIHELVVRLGRLPDSAHATPGAAELVTRTIEAALRLPDPRSGGRREAAT